MGWADPPSLSSGAGGRRRGLPSSELGGQLPPTPCQSQAQDTEDALRAGEATIEEAISNVHLLAADGRILLAGDLLTKVETLLASLPAGALRTRLQQHMSGRKRAELSRLRANVAECKAAMSELSKVPSGAVDGWSSMEKVEGFETRYRTTRDGVVQVRIDGPFVGVNIVDQIVVAREVGCMAKWAPQCERATLVKVYSDLERIVHLELTLPMLLTRECVVRSFTADLTELDVILLCGASVGSDALPFLRHLPAPSTNVFAKYMEVKSFRAMLRLASLDSGQLSCVVAVNPNMLLPDQLAALIISRCMRGMLLDFHSAAKQITADAETEGSLGHVLAARMREDPYYSQRLFPRLMRYAESKKFPWTGHAALQRLDSPHVAFATHPYEIVMSEGVPEGVLEKVGQRMEALLLRKAGGVRSPKELLLEGLAAAAARTSKKKRKQHQKKGKGGLGEHINGVPLASTKDVDGSKWPGDDHALEGEGRAKPSSPSDASKRAARGMSATRVSGLKQKWVYYCRIILLYVVGRWACLNIGRQRMAVGGEMLVLASLTNFCAHLMLTQDGVRGQPFSSWLWTKSGKLACGPWSVMTGSAWVLAVSVAHRLGALGAARVEFYHRQGLSLVNTLLFIAVVMEVAMHSPRTPRRN